MSKTFRGESLVGKKFERLTVLSFVPDNTGHSYWLCECDCENKTQKIVRGSHLKKGKTKSCGCLVIDTLNKRAIDKKIVLDKDILQKMYIEEQQSRETLAKYFNCSLSTIDRNLKDYNILSGKKGRNTLFSKDVENTIILEYLNGYGTKDLSIKYKTSANTIKELLERNNIERRLRSPLNKYNINFFKTYTKESCYWAGFIAADGNIKLNNKQVSIHLAIKDLKHLEKFKNCIDFNGKIYQYEKDCQIFIGGEWYPTDLENNFEIFPQKTFNFKISEKIPKEFIPDFIRGYFDGDGGISYCQNIPHISFTSGSIKLLEQFQLMFFDMGITLKSKNKYPPINNNKTINYTGKNAVLILKWLYDRDLNDLLYLDRKYIEYQKCKKQYSL